MSFPRKLSSVQMPASQLYDKREPETIRDRFVAQYGEATVQRAELQVVLDLFMLMRVVSPQEFVEVMERKLTRIDQLRQMQAGVKND